MMISQQLLLWPETEAERNAREIAELKAHCNKLRKSLYARNNELGKQYMELSREFEQLKAAICRYEKTHVNQESFL